MVQISSMLYKLGIGEEEAKKMLSESESVDLPLTKLEEFAVERAKLHDPEEDHKNDPE